MLVSASAPYNSPSIIKYSYDTSSVFGDRKLPDGRVGMFLISEFHGHSQSTTSNAVDKISRQLLNACSGSARELRTYRGCLLMG